MNPGTVGIEAALHVQKRLVGQTIGTSGWVCVDQDMIDLFAESTNDHQYIHVDPVKARRCSPYSGTIAHGFLTMSLASRFSREALEPVPGQIAGLNYGLDKVRFVSPRPFRRPGPRSFLPEIRTDPSTERPSPNPWAGGRNQGPAETGPGRGLADIGFVRASNLNSIPAAGLGSGHGGRRVTRDQSPTLM